MLLKKFGILILNRHEDQVIVMKIMTKSMKKRALKRFFYSQGLYHICLNRCNFSSTCAGCIPLGYDKEISHWVWVDLLDHTRTSAAKLVLGKKVFCFLAPDWLEEETHPSMPLVDLALRWLVDALDGTLPTTSSLDEASLGEIGINRKFIDVDDFSFERLVIEMDIRQ